MRPDKSLEGGLHRQAGPDREPSWSVLRDASGDIFWIHPDESRGSIPGRAHPHVVAQDDVFNFSRLTTVIVCGLSTNARVFNEPGNVLLQAGEANPTKQSVIVVSQISSVRRSQPGEYVGTLSANRVDEALAGLRLQQNSFRVRAPAADV